MTVKKRKISKGKFACITVALLICAATLITGAVALLYDYDKESNVFTVGNVEVELKEPNWDEENGVDVLPLNKITKDPTIKNTGSADAFVYMLVSVPKADDIKTRENGVTSTVNDFQLFEYAINQGWTLIDSKIDTSDKNNYYLYAYTSALSPDTETPALFNEFTVRDLSQESLVTGEYDIKVKGYAIQSDFYNNEATDAASAWQLYVNQNGWEWPVNPAGPHYTLKSYDGSIIKKIAIPDGATTITLPDNPLTNDFPTNIQFKGWVSETELIFDCGETATIESLHYTDEYGNVANEYPVLTEAVNYIISDENADTSLPVKLIPLNEASTAMINRDGVIESYVDESFEVITDVYGYETPEDYERWVVYGLDVKLTHHRLFNEFVKVQGDGYAIVENKYGEYLGSGSTIKVYDRNSTVDTADDTLVEQFYIVIVGDPSGDGQITDWDRYMVSNEIGYVTVWSRPAWGEYIFYKHCAADINGDERVLTSDSAVMNEIMGEIKNAKDYQIKKDLYGNYFITYS